MPVKTLSPERLKRFHDMVDDYPNKRSMLMMTLRLVEEEFGCINDEAMEIAADLCGVTPAHVQGMVTFYTHFKRSAHGKHRFMVCATLMCALDGNTDQALKQIESKLGLKPGQRTQDGLFSCEKVECLADCDKPPVVQKDFEHFCSMKGKALDDYIESLLKLENKTSAEYQNSSGVEMDLRISVLPSHYNFEGETESGARQFDDKDPYFKPGEAPRTTSVPPPLLTPLTAPVADGVNMNGAQHG
ncbi:MAG TPA: hypothetical protein DCQ83_01210 [Fibrobacteres bacterium]|jgi:NADH:ubiquinone oxidoreductase subunit E|nr:hypothetical protein [Fibrobacterota bacterium]